MASALDTLRIRLFGGLEVHRGDRLLPSFPTQKSSGVFAFLALHSSRSYSREVLSGIFWGESGDASARKALRTALWRIRTTVDAGGGTPTDSALRVQGSSVALNESSIASIDVADFERRIRAAGGRDLTPERAELLREAIELYRGDLLEGVYDDWCMNERERFRLMYITSLESLISFDRQRRRFDLAIETGQRLLDADPLREHVHRELMRCYAEQGNRSAALRQFTVCADLLRSELQVEPMPETVALRDEIFNLSESAEPLNRADPLPREGDRRKDTLQRAQRLLDRVDESLVGLHDMVDRLERAQSSLQLQLRRLEAERPLPIPSHPIGTLL